jgi:hypothetical protein
MASKIWRNLIRTAAAACFVAGSNAQAGGVFYQSDFDPVSFIVKVIYKVDTRCLETSGLVWANNGGDCTVEFYSVVATLKDSNGNKGYVDFVPEGQVTLYPSIIKAIYVDEGASQGSDDNQLVGVAMLPTLIGPATTRNIYNGGTEYDSKDDLNGTWWLSFLTADLGLQIFADTLANFFDRDFQYTPPFEASALLYQRVCGWSSSCWPEQVQGEGGVAELLGPNDPVNPTSGYVHKGSNIRVDSDGNAIPIPEPGSLALLGGALVAGWITRRRKAAA